MIQRKIGEKFVYTDKDKNKYLIKTVLFKSIMNQCGNCFFNSFNCKDEVIINLTGGCTFPVRIFVCIKTNKNTHENKA